MDTQAVAATSNALTELLLRKENLYLMAGAWIVLQTILRFLPISVMDSPWTIRVLPIAPIILCSIGVWIPGLQSDSVQVGERIMVGLILGYAVAHSYKITLQSILGKDVRIVTAREKKKAMKSLVKSDTPTKDLTK